MKTQALERVGAHGGSRRWLWSGAVAAAAAAALWLGGAGGALQAQMVQPSFTIAAPAAGATVGSPVLVKVTMRGAQIGKPSSGLDHLHITVDGGEPTPIYDKPELSVRLAPGKHTVVVDLAGPDHQPLAPPKSVSFVVR